MQGAPRVCCGESRGIVLNKGPGSKEAHRDGTRAFPSWSWEPPCADVSCALLPLAETLVRSNQLRAERGGGGLKHADAFCSPAKRCWSPGGRSRPQREAVSWLRARWPLSARGCGGQDCACEQEGLRAGAFAVCSLVFQSFSAVIGIHSSHFSRYCQPGLSSTLKSYFFPC